MTDGLRKLTSERCWGEWPVESAVELGRCSAFCGGLSAWLQPAHNAAL